MKRPDWFTRVWDKRKEPSSVHRTKKQRPTPITRDDRQQQALLDAIERQRRQWDRYVAARQSRLDQLAKQYPQVRKFKATLRSLLADPEVEWTGPRDCNIDFVELSEDLHLASIPRVYDRFLLLEVTRDFITTLGKRRRIEPERLLDDPTPFPDRENETPCELDRLRKALNLT